MIYLTKNLKSKPSSQPILRQRLETEIAKLFYFTIRTYIIRKPAAVEICTSQERILGMWAALKNENGLNMYSQNVEHGRKLEFRAKI